MRTKGDQTFSLPGVKKIKLFEDQWPQFLIFSLAGKKSSVGRCPDRQPLGAVRWYSKNVMIERALMKLILYADNREKRGNRLETLIHEKI
ncbi:MAG: hypothetical protein R6U68_07415, partial [Desulfobacteraceae bacterium]